MKGKQLTRIVPIALALALLAVTAIPIGVHALSPYQSGHEHGTSDAEKLIQGRVNDMYILQPGKGWTDHTGQFIQGYVEALNSTAGIPKDFKAGYDYVNNERSQYGPGTEWDQHHTTPHPFVCPLWHTAPRSNFCIGYDAGLAYQNSDN